MTRSRKPRIPGWSLRRTWIVGVLIALATLAGAVPVAGQGSAVAVDDFDQDGLEAVMLASFDAGGDTTLYAASGSPWGAHGSLVEGEVVLGGNTSITRIMLPNANGSLLRLNDGDGDGDGLVLRDFFGQSGAGADLTVWVQTSAGTASFPASGVDTAGKNYVNFNVPTSQRSVLTGINANDRFLLALTRPEPNQPPSFPDGDNDGTADAVARTVEENATSGNAGAAIGAADPDGDTLAYSVAQTSDSNAAENLTAFNRDFSLDPATGQVSVKAGAEIDFETRDTYKVLLQVTDSKDMAGETDDAVDDTAVLTITVTNLNEDGAVSISGTVQVGQELTAALEDPDGTASNLAWKWARSETKKGTYTDITGETAAAYTVAEGDADGYLRASATYTDPVHSVANQAASATVGPVEPETARSTNTNTGPSFPDTGNDGADPVARSIAENVTSGNLGAAITATDPDSGDTLSYSWTQTSGETVTLSGAATAQTTFTAPSGATEALTLTFSLQVTDQGQLSHTDSVTVTVAAPATPEPEPEPEEETDTTPTPLTAAASSVPATHDGSSVFTFELRFSEEPKDGFSYQTMKEHALTVTGGSVKKANRLNPPSNIGWLMHIAPSGSGTVTIVLPPTTDCAATGAICTNDGRVLSGTLTVTVNGP